MAMWVQVNSGNISSVTWYRADNIEWDTNYLWPFNQKGGNKGYMEIRTSSKPLYLKFTPANAVNLQGVILAVNLGIQEFNYEFDMTVELQESTDGSTWNTVRSKTIHFPDDVNASPVNQYGKYMIDFRFDISYLLSLSNQYRFKIYRGSASHSPFLQLSKNASWSSWQSDVSNYAFRIIYSDTTGTPTDSDVFVITDELIIDQDWTVGYVTIPTSPSKDRLDSYNNKGSLWITSKGRLYVPSSITSDITVEIKGRMYISGGDRVAWQIGDSEENPIPVDRIVNWFFNCEGTNRRAGIFAYRSSWMKIEHYGSPIEKWYAVLKYDADKNTNQIVVEGDVTDEWHVGDKIRIGASKYSSTRHYFDFQRDHTYYEISSLSYDSINNETTITLTSNLAYIHEAGGRVLLMRRNVNIYGDEISVTDRRAETYVYMLRWWRAYWVRYSYMRYPIYIDWYNPKISLSEYPHNDIFKGVLADNFHYIYIRNRKGGYLENIATTDSKNSGWTWGDGSYTFYRCKDFTIKNLIGLTNYFPVYLIQSSGIVLDGFWMQGRYPIYLSLTSNCKIYNGEVVNSQFFIYLSGSNNNEIYNITVKNIYVDSNNAPTTSNYQGCFYYSGDIFSQNNYIHDITIENAFSLFSIDVDDGCDDWYHNVTYSNITTEVWEVFRSDWIDQTRIRFTKRNGIENNDWIIYKYGEVHKTGDYENADDTLHRTDFGGKFALRLEPKVEGEEFKDYKILLTGAKKGKPVSYVGYVYVKSGYFDGDYELPEIYLEGCGIDYSSEPSAKWTHPGSSYADTWVSFSIVGTPQEDGNVYAIIRLKSDGSEPHFYIDDDIYTWAESIDWRGHEVWIDGQPSYPPAKFPVLTAMEIWEQPTNVLTAENTIGKLVVDMNSEVENHRDTVEPKIDVNISSRASQESVNAIPTNPLLDNDPRLDNLDVAVSSRLASNDSRLDNLDAKISTRSSHSPADVWNYSTRELTNPDNYKADVSSLAKESTVQAIKSQTDKLKFNINNDVIATLDGEQVNLTSETEQQIDNIESYVSNPEQYKADVSSLAKESTVQAIKTQTDKLQFTTDNDVKATLDGEAVVLTNDTKSQIDNIESAVNQIKIKTDNLPTDPASNTSINNARDSIITEIHANKDLIDLLLKAETGNWEIKDNQWIYYDKDGNELFKFNLYDKDGKPSETNVYKRVRI